MKKTLLVSCIAFTLFQARAQKIYFNEEWTNFTGSVGEISHTSSVVSFGNLIVVSNTLNTSGNTDVLISKYNKRGTLLWEKTFDGPDHQNDYGVKVVADKNNGDIYVAASIGTNTNESDFGVIKYSTSGIEKWKKLFDYQNGQDIPADILLGGGSSVYVVGSGEASNGYADLIVQRYYMNNGHLIWETHYDYAHLHDGGVQLSVNSGYLVATGVSAQNAVKWDNLMLKIKPNDGAIVSVKRSSIPQANICTPTALAEDSSNNIYIAGYVGDTSNIDIRLMKIDSGFNIEWTRTFDGGGLNEDQAKDVGIDADGNIYVTGFSRRANNTADYVTLKYDENGNLLWKQNYAIEGDTNNAIASSLIVNPDGSLFVTGTAEKNNEKYINTIYYDSAGNIKLVLTHNDQTGRYDNPQILANEDGIYITDIKNANNGKKVTAIHYTLSERLLQTVLVDSVASHFAHEIIVRFNKDVVIPSAINKVGFNFGTLDQFVKSNIIDSLHAVYPSINWQRVTTYKIFKRMTMADSISISRNGHTVKVQPFWATLLLDVGNANEQTVIDSLRGKTYPYIRYLQPNFLISLASDDPDFSLQQSLVSTAYPDGDINILPAWTVETGRSSVKVGVYDSGVKWSHEDLGGGFATQYSKVQGGWDYEINASLYNTPNNGDPIQSGNTNGHGTSVAGIIAAIRDNQLGIAGVAGGHLPLEGTIEDNPTIDPGVSIYGFRVLHFAFGYAEMCNALVEGASNTTNGYGYGLDIMNNSYGSNVEYENTGYGNLFEDCQREIFHNQVVFVACRGNKANTNNYFPEYAKEEDWVISVGADTTDGSLATFSSYGSDMDLIAPGVSTMVYTLGNNANNEYKSFNGTSAAAPHVSGVAGLMLSHINDRNDTPNNLAPDDVEFLLQKYAEDKTSVTNSGHLDYLVGYDDKTGWGLLDAGNVMQYIDRSQYIVKHVTLETTCSVSSYTQGTYFYQDANLPFGLYQIKVYPVSYTLNNNLQTGDVILNYWPLNSYANLLAKNTGPYAPGNNDFIENEKGQTIPSMNNTQGVISGVVLHIVADQFNNPLDFWYPAAPGQPVRVGYTLHLQSNYASIQDNKAPDYAFNCYPNPTNEQMNVSFETGQDAKVALTVYDINGRLIEEKTPEIMSAGKHIINLTTSSWTKGLYFVNLSVNENTTHAKVIKN